MTPRNGAAQPDPELLLPRVAQGDAAAVKECLDKYGALVWSIVRKSIQDHSQAEDLVQEIFISLYKTAGRYDPKLGPEALFITTIARRRLIDRYRSKSRAPEVESLDEVAVGAEADPGLARIETQDEANVAREALSRLRPQQKRLLEMWVLGGLTHTEIATSTGIPLGTVKSQIRRGLIQVRELLQGGPLTPSTEVPA